LQLQLLVRGGKWLSGLQGETWPRAEMGFGSRALREPRAHGGERQGAGAEHLGVFEGQGVCVGPSRRRWEQRVSPGAAAWARPPVWLWAAKPFRQLKSSAALAREGWQLLAATAGLHPYPSPSQHAL